MKFILVGLHGSGKREVLDYLEKEGVACGRLFTNGSLLGNYDFFSDQEIRSIFENKAYVFIQELTEQPNCFEGLTIDEFDKADVFALSPDQVVSIPNTPLKDDICFVWMDNTMTNRRTRYDEEKREYNFNEREEYERGDIDEFTHMIYTFPKSHLLYFRNEDPSRVATIVYTLIQHPELVPMYLKNFN